ncbi:hypothetical protein E9529_15495 [Blastococcus sp. KM273128]|uniref:hypothetical protein n=1 Tax=Blastococcus sp. KM273128 TaxID=2570314 RepID=UPI001F39E745|nr:hypothetical protein [Blastococcus sp. KM273128]MCF6745652.1 hypothetical protein [Blastococcus sp. KM273128]
MSQPPTPPESGPSAAPSQGGPGWPPPTAGWPGVQPVPDWAAGTSWQPAAPAVPPPAAAAPAHRGRWLLAGAALGGVAVGTVATALLLGAVAVGSAADVGRAVAAELGPALTDGIRDGMVEGSLAQLEDAMEGYGEEAGGWYGGATGEAVEQFPPVAPADLGPDDTLDAYAESCFGGELQACDDLMYESPPLSAYEEYASTCGGRVKAYTVVACTELG